LPAVTPHWIEAMIKNYDRLAEFVNRINQSGGSYHYLDLGEGLVIQGDYDMTQYLQYYPIPVDLTGKRVLDVGTSSGFFALECAKRGASVVAIDIWDQAVPLEQITEATGANIQYIQKSIYDLTPEFGSFDLVICGSLLLHLPDPFGAIQRLKSVCRGQLIVSTSCMADSPTVVEPICQFLGEKAKDGDYWHYWALSGAALKQMLVAAGFSTISEPMHFRLDTLPDRIQFGGVLHVSFSAIV
jgi:tRNA (mo5U34)-methyltransferase